MSDVISEQMPMAAAKLQATYANRVNIAIGVDGISRLTFGTDLPGNSVEWHSAIVMTNASLESIYTTLGQVLQQAARAQSGGRPS